MTSAVTLGQVEAMPPQDQQRLIESISERLAARQDYFTRAKAFLKTCLEIKVGRDRLLFAKLAVRKGQIRTIRF